MRVLLHSCCGPCSSACVPRLKALGHEVTLFFTNCNINTQEEFEKRLCAAKKLAEQDGVEIIVDDYDHQSWLKNVAAGLEDAPEKGARCAKCFRYSLRRTALYAQKNGYDAFTTSLSVSPHKISAIIFQQGKAIEDELKVSSNTSLVFLAEDFKKKEGFKLSVARAKELDLYRQSYCGCEFSCAIA